MAPSPSNLSHQIEIELGAVQHQEDVARIEHNAPLSKAIFHDAKQATETEHELTPLHGLRMYPKAVAWSVFVSMAVVMDGYDQAFLGQLYAEKSFQKQFGKPFRAGYQLTAPWQTALTISSSIGVMIGIFLNGYLSERIGMRKTMLCSYVALTGLIFILVFGTSNSMILVGQILCGIPWGIFHTTAPAYASEVCPVVLRGYLTTFINMSAIIGQLISAGVMRGVEGMTGRWAYDIPFALEWIWPVPLFIGMLFCPESPWWLLRQGRVDDAERSLQRLSNGAETQQTIAMMIRTNQEEMLTGGASYLDCLKGTDLRRTEIAFCSWGIQAFSGLPMQSYNTYFFEQAGLPDSKAFDLSIGYYAIGFVGTASSWFLITWFGRRSIFLVGLACMCVTMFTIGFVSLAPASSGAAAWVQSVLLVLWVFLYDISVGPVAWCIASEVSATRLRAPTIAIGRNSFYLWNIIFGVATPYMLNPTKGDWKGKAGFLFGGTCLLAVLWTYFRLPELKGRTYEELNILFWKKVPARKFASTHVDAYEEEQYVNPVVQEVLDDKK